MKKILILLIPLLGFFAGCDGTNAIQDNINVTVVDIPQTVGITFDPTQYVTTRNNIYTDTLNGLVYHYTNNGSITSGSSVYFMGCTDSRTIHFLDYELISDSSPIIIDFYEAPTVTANGTLVNSSNMNRQSYLNSSLTLYGGPTITNEGTLLFRKAILTDKKASGELATSLNWVLDSETCYLFKITNQAGATITYYSNFFWNEEN